MKKTFRTLVTLCAATFITAACSDVPMPYELNNNNATGKSLPYSNSSLSTGCTVYTPEEYSISWTLGSSYAQVSGYSNSTYTETESWLISPALNTTTSTGVYFTFDYTIRYGTSADIEGNHKIVASCDWDGTLDNVADATWIELAFTPEASSYSDWTVYPSNSIALPDELLNKPIVYIAWKYKCGKTQSTVTTWEIKNLVVRTGFGGDKVEGDNQNPTGTLFSSSNLNSGFDVKAIKGTPWSLGSSYAKASGYDSSTKLTTPSESWLISPAINTAGVENVKISFNYELKYAASLMDNQKVYISADYAGDVTTATWTDLEVTLENDPGSTWDFEHKAEVQLPAEFVGKQIYLGFWWKCDDKSSSTWELKNLDVEEGIVSETTPSTPTEGNSYGLVTSIDPGVYIWGANVDGTYKIAANYSASSNYGYISSTDFTAKEGVITNSIATNEWTIAAVSGGYTIQDSYGRYLYMTGTYNSFNIAATTTEGQIWSISIADNGEATITNVSTGKTIQWNSEYKNYGAYSDVTNSLPSLFKKDASADVTDGGNTGGAGASKDSPYTCAQVISLANPGTSAYVAGYIVGYVNGNSISSGATFGVASDTETEVLIADSPSETDYTKTVPIQLPIGDLRTALNPSIASNIGKKVVLYGSLEKYFGVPGVKSTSWALLDGVTIGTEPK